MDDEESRDESAMIILMQRDERRERSTGRGRRSTGRWRRKEYGEG